MSAPANLLYVGTYTRHGRSDGIHLVTVHPDRGALQYRRTQAEVDPSFSRSVRTSEVVQVS